VIAFGRVRRAHVVVVLSMIAWAPFGASAQTRYAEGFDAWTDACIAAGLCGSTAMDAASRDAIRVSSACATAGGCVELRYDTQAEITMDPFGHEWAPSPNGIAVSVWVNLEPEYFDADGSFRSAFAELVRAYCKPEPCNLLFELHLDPADAAPVLVWQREAVEDAVVRIVCALPIHPTPGWHRAYARARWDGTTAMGQCELAWDDLAMSAADVSYAGEAGEPTSLSDVLIAGSSTVFLSPGPRPGLDELCIGASDVDCPRGALVPVDGGASSRVPALGFRGGGGCACSAGTRDATPHVTAFGALFVATLSALCISRCRRAALGARASSRRGRAAPPHGRHR